jgi:hypothetical protein
MHKNRNNANLEELMDLCKNEVVYNECKETWQYSDEWIALAAFELKCCFNQWDFILKSPYPYKDKHWGMTVYRCDDFQKKNTGLPSIETLLSQTKLGKRDIHLSRVMKSLRTAIGLYKNYCAQEGDVDHSDRFTNLMKEVFQ